MGIAERGRGALWGEIGYRYVKDQKLAAKSCTWFDTLFKKIGILATVIAILYLVYRFFFKPYWIILKLPLAHQLGI